MLALLLAATTPPTLTAEEQQQIDIEALTVAKLEMWPRLYRENDAEGLGRFLADGFVAMQPDGSTESKADAVAWVRANKWTNAQKNFRYEIKAITFYAPDLANVYGIGSFDRDECRAAYSSANIFVRQDGRWRPKFSHTSQPSCIKDAQAS